MSLMTDLNRLERAGFKNSAANVKLRAATYKVQQIITNLIAQSLLPTELDEDGISIIRLPRGYCLGNHGLETPARNRLSFVGVPATLAECQQFARDLVDGLLVEITNQIDLHERNVRDATSILERTRV